MYSTTRLKNLQILLPQVIAALIEQYSEFTQEEKWEIIIKDRIILKFQIYPFYACDEVDEINCQITRRKNSNFVYFEIKINFGSYFLKDDTVTLSDLIEYFNDQKKFLHFIGPRLLRKKIKFVNFSEQVLNIINTFSN